MAANSYIGLIDWLEKNSKPCFYKKHFGIECPGCGFQRSVIELAQGNIIESIKLFPALIPIIATFLYLGLHLKFNFNNGTTIIKVLFITTIAIVIINYVYKITLN